MTSTLKRLAGAEEGARPEAGGTQGTGCPLARAPLRGKDSARGRPPTPAGVARPARDTMGPAGRADGSGPAAGRERETGGGGRVAAEGRPRAGIGARLGAKGRGVPAGDPTKTQGALRPKPSLAGGARGERRWQVGSLELPGGAIMGGGGAGPPHAGKSPLSASTAPLARCTTAATRLARARPNPRRWRRRWKVRGAPKGGRGRGGGESWVRVCFVLPGWLRARPRGRTRWPGERGPPRPRSGRPGAALAGSLPAPRLGLSGSASPSSSRPPARSLAPGAWIDLVALASGSRSRPASTPPLPIPGALALPLPRSLTRAPARAAAAAARPGILSKFPAPPARAPGPRRLPRPPPR